MILMRSTRSVATIGYALGFASLIGVGLCGIGMLRNRNIEFAYLIYNLFLAFIPLVLALWLQKLLKTRSWKSWLSVVITILWSLFLPNSFYIVSDFVHLPEVSRVDIIQDVVMLAQFSFVGLALGFMSLYVVHTEFSRRVSRRLAIPFVVMVLFACSFAIYLGRELRWNSWDAIIHPLALAADIVEHIFHPLVYPQTYTTTLTFFGMLLSMYGVTWYLKRGGESRQ